MTIRRLDPLDWQVPLVSQDGRPTPEFQRKWAAMRANTSQIPTVTLGTGAPGGVPATTFYFDTSTTPWTLYAAGADGAWHRAGVVKFTELQDAPASYAGKGNYLVRVKSTVDGVEFATVSAAIDSAIGSTRGAILERGAAGWTIITPGTAGSVFASAGAGADPAWGTLSSLLDSVFGSTRGSLLERGASLWQIITPGTSGYVLTSQGAGADPTWTNQNPSSGVGEYLVQRTVTSGSQTSVTVSTAGIPAQYHHLLIRVTARGLRAGQTFDDIGLQINGDTGNNYYGFQLNDTGAGGAAPQCFQSSPVDHLPIGPITAASAVANSAGQIEATILNFDGSAWNKIARAKAFTQFQTGSGSQFGVDSGGQWQNNAAVTSLKIYPLNAGFVNGSIVEVLAVQ